MSFLDTACSVLREERQWMHAKDLVQEVLDQGLYTSMAKDPIASLTSTLYPAASRGSNRRGLMRHGPMFGLKEWGAEIPPPDNVMLRELNRESAAEFKTWPLSQLEAFTDLLERAREQRSSSPNTQDQQSPLVPQTQDEVEAVEAFQDFLRRSVQRYEEQELRSPITQISDSELLDRVRHEVNQIHDFLLGQSIQDPSPQLITNWIVLCYQLQLYREGVAVFKQIGPDQIGEALYKHVSKIAKACRMHLRE